MINSILTAVAISLLCLTVPSIATTEKKLASPDSTQIDKMKIIAFFKHTKEEDSNRNSDTSFEKLPNTQEGTRGQ